MLPATSSKNAHAFMNLMALDQQFGNRAGAFLERVHRTAELLQDGEVQVGHRPLVPGPLGVVTVLEAQGFAAGKNGRSWPSGRRRRG